MEAPWRRRGTAAVVLLYDALHKLHPVRPVNSTEQYLHVVPQRRAFRSGTRDKISGRFETFGDIGARTDVRQQKEYWVQTTTGEG